MTTNCCLPKTLWGTKGQHSEFILLVHENYIYTQSHVPNCNFDLIFFSPSFCFIYVLIMGWMRGICSHQWQEFSSSPSCPDLLWSHQASYTMTTKGKAARALKWLIQLQKLRHYTIMKSVVFCQSSYASCAKLWATDPCLAGLELFAWVTHSSTIWLSFLWLKVGKGGGTVQFTIKTITCLYLISSTLIN
jgi:hypothetical protein